MNFQHFKYVVEVEKTGSISQAAENLFMNQPNLSKAIKDLEHSLGITLFHRTSRGVTPTAEGKEFLEYARGILSQVEKMKAHFSGQDKDCHTLRLSIPRSSYIAEAFTAFVASLDPQKGMDITFSEVGTLQAIKNILEEKHHLAIIRYQSMYESYYLRFLEDQGLEWEEFWEFESLVLMSKNHPLTACPQLDARQLKQYVEIAHDDLSIPNVPIREAKVPSRRIYVQDRGSQMDLLTRIPQTYMWVSPMPHDLLERNGLVQRRCAAHHMAQKDVLVYPKGHLPGLEQQFVEKLKEARAQVQTTPVF
ncbi:MAG: LysR family transcriptional regulator [Oscillospiraceae bacterium]|jgi:DNA-binding transcriptional LysR family regulator